MNSTASHPEMSDSELLKTLKTAVATSKRSLFDDGILLMLWGGMFTIGFLLNYYKSTYLVVWWERNIIDTIHILGGIVVIGITIYFIFFRKKTIRTYTAISTRFVWIGIILAHNLNVIITKGFLHDVNFALLHPLQMVLIGFALFVTGGIYRYYLLSAFGVIYWVAAWIGSGLELSDQYLLRAIADFICFVIPGILMYMQNKKPADV
ncbi:hypothetical protein [Maribellus mangrovi]|uniref:hypothetical protein n=1 Tax=Maribellus mangrovi TaxID=3133146 RepID=UPI0030EBDE14